MSTEPYYQDEHVTLFHSTLEDALPMLAGETFDAIVTDPPYGETSLKWDLWPDGWPSLVAPLARSMWCFGSMRMFLKHGADFSDWRLSQDIVWEKNNGSSLAADRFRRVHEHALHWYQGPWSEVYHQTPTTPDATPHAFRRKALPPQHQGARGPSVYVSQDGGPRLMRSVQYVRSMHGRGINETEKPTGILEPLIEYAVPPGGILLDPFAGSCSSGLAARALGRRAVLIEKRESQCEAAANRLAQGVLDLTGGAA